MRCRLQSCARRTFFRFHLVIPLSCIETRNRPSTVHDAVLPGWCGRRGFCRRIHPTPLLNPTRKAAQGWCNIVFLISRYREKCGTLVS